MSSGLIVLLEAGLVLGGVIGLAVWELMSLRRERGARTKYEPPND